MNKIPFEDGVKTQEAYVTIEGQNYPVTPAVWQGKTPLSTFNLNKMQDNIDIAKAEKSDLDSLTTEVGQKANQADLDSLTTEVGKKANQSDLNNIWTKIYPVGAIFISVNNTNPSELFGGTWKVFATGRTLVGVDTSQNEFNAAEKAGGEKSHKLTIEEIPSHSHGLRTTSSNSIDTGYALRPEANLKFRYDKAYNSAEGGGNAHNNLQPYVTVFMWKRTA